jgi:hypothetical protein
MSMLRLRDAQLLQYPIRRNCVVSNCRLTFQIKSGRIPGSPPLQWMRLTRTPFHVLTILHRCVLATNYSESSINSPDPFSFFGTGWFGHPHGLGYDPSPWLRTLMMHIFLWTWSIWTYSVTAYLVSVAQICCSFPLSTAIGWLLWKRKWAWLNYIFRQINIWADWS